MIDWDGSGDYDRIGENQTTMGALMGAKKQVFTGPLTLPGQNKNRGTLIVRAEAVEESKLTAIM